MKGQSGEQPERSDAEEAGHAPHVGRVFLDGTDRNADWSKTRGLDVSLDTEEKFREWMASDGITPEHLRRMAIFSEYNRALYPWLDRLAEIRP